MFLHDLVVHRTLHYLLMFNAMKNMLFLYGFSYFFALWFIKLATDA